MKKNFFENCFIYIIFLSIFCGNLFCSCELNGVKRRIDFLNYKISVYQDKNLLANFKIDKNEIEKLNIELAKLQSIQSEMARLENSCSDKDVKDDERKKSRSDFFKLMSTYFCMNANGKYLIRPESKICDLTYNNQLNLGLPSFIDPASLRGYCKNVNGRIIQLRVVLQISENGGGAATCGYQALLNSFIITRLILSSPIQRALLLYELTDKNLRMDLFGSKNAPWRSAIINSRRNKVFRNFFNNVLMRHSFDEKDIKERITTDSPQIGDCRMFQKFDDEIKKYITFSNENGDNERKFFFNRTTINAFAAYLANDVCRMGIGDIILNSDYIMSKFISAIDSESYFEKLRILDNGKIDHKNEIEEKIKKYFPTLCSGNKIKISNEEISDQNSGLFLEPSQWKIMLSGKRDYAPGEWLEGEEICKIVDIETQSGNLTKGFFLYYLDDILPGLTNLIESYYCEPVQIVRYADIQKQKMDAKAIADGVKVNPEDFVPADVKQVIAFVRDPNESGFRIMIIIVNGDHWIPFVINKRKRMPGEPIGPDLQYIIADSMDNDYTWNGQIKELLQKLEGREDIPEFRSSCVIC